jgi:hypothetical protein
MSMAEFTSGPHALVFQFFKFSGLEITNLDRIHLLTVDSGCSLEFKNPACRFSSYGHCADELTGHGNFLFWWLRWQIDANNRQNEDDTLVARCEFHASSVMVSAILPEQY